MNRRHSALVTLLVTSLAGSAFAEPTPAEKQMAEGLFQEAKKLYAAGKIPEACTKYEESQKIAPGGGTILSLAICREDEGKLATALVLFQEALAKAKTAKREDREKTATEHIAAIQPKISKVTVTIASEVEGLEVKLDSTVVPRAVWGTEVPVDAGTHTLTATAPGKTAWSTTITVGKIADRKTVTVPKLEGGSKDAPPPPVPTVPVTTTKPDESTPPPPPATPPSPPTNDTAPTSSGTRTMGLVVGGIGVVLLASGAYFALRAGSLKDEASSADAAGDFGGADSKTSDARGAQTFARIGVGVGLAAVATGVVLFVISPSSSNKSASIHMTPMVGASTGGFSIIGRF